MVEFPTVKQREKTRVSLKIVAMMSPLWPANCCHDSLNRDDVHGRSILYLALHLTMHKLFSTGHCSHLALHSNAQIVLHRTLLPSCNHFLGSPTTLLQPSVGFSHASTTDNLATFRRILLCLHRWRHHRLPAIHEMLWTEIREKQANIN